MAIKLIRIYSNGKDSLIFREKDSGEEYKFHPKNGDGYNISRATFLHMLGDFAKSSSYVKTELSREQLVQLKNIIKQL